MTEYDYSPEAYDRYLATQRRIANWVDQTEHHRPQFGPTTQSVADTSNSRTKHHRHYYRPPPSDSGSDDSYADGPGYPGPMPGLMPGPMPLHSPPPFMYPQQPIYQPMVPPLVSPGYTFPPIYPNHHRSSRSHRRSQNSQSPRHPSAFHYTSPPTSPMYPHGYPPPPMVSYPPPGFVMMPPPPPRGRKMSVMVSLAPYYPSSIILTLRYLSVTVSLNYLFFPTTSKSHRSRRQSTTSPTGTSLKPASGTRLVSWPAHPAAPPSHPLFITLCGATAAPAAGAQQSSAALHVLPPNLPF